MFRFNAGPAKPATPAEDIARLLNQHTSHFINLERELKEVKERQRAAGAAYAAGLEARDAARAALLRAEHGAAGAEAEGLHFRAELESSQAANGKLQEEVDALKREVESQSSLADEARRAFGDQVAQMLAALQQLKLAHPQAFFGAGSAEA